MIWCQLLTMEGRGERPKTKIVCTLGPASRSVEVIEKLLRAGMNVARFNFSHGSHPYHQQTLDNLRTAMSNTHTLCAVMLDTKVSLSPLLLSLFIYLHDLFLVLGTGFHELHLLNPPSLPPLCIASELIFKNPKQFFKH